MKKEWQEALQRDSSGKKKALQRDGSGSSTRRYEETAITAVVVATITNATTEPI